MISIDLKKVKDRDAELYQVICDTFGFLGDVAVHEIRDAKFKHLASEFRERLQKQMADPEPRIDPNEAVKRTKIVDAEAGAERLDQYARGGLENTEHNATAIRKFLVEHPQINGVVTAGTIEAAISHLGPNGANVLTWKPQTVVPPPPKPEAVILKDGSPQLPLDAMPTYKHTKEQLKDLDARKRAAGKQDRKGWHGTSL